MKNETSEKTEVIILGGGCFWCLEAVYRRVRGVISVVSGYAGGVASDENKDPTYEKVSAGGTGYAEVVKIEFDANEISLEDILNIFFTIHNPTTLNRQGNDVGTQYRSIIFYADENQRRIAELVRNDFAERKIYENPIVTELVPSDGFYPAEDYHQRYFEKNPEKAYCQGVVAPKISRLRKEFERFYK